MSQHQLVTRNAPCLPQDEPGVQRAWDNRAHVRRLLAERQPEFARALAAAVRDLTGQEPVHCQSRGCPLCGKTRAPGRPTVKRAERDTAERASRCRTS